MKDSLLLLATGLSFAGVGWVFWHYLGQAALETMTLIALASATVDNVRLRRRLRKLANTSLK